uniref:TRAF3-interacting protein 1 N-terminal domain-containing protein n=1 Tax=Strix occidentalis caurina TaxID=311401 RepID=A0A8D0KTV2_STROC
MNEAVVRRTQESLGRVIRKPPLTDRLLSKPPFRYLHDVITEVGDNAELCLKCICWCLHCESSGFTNHQG